MYDWFPMYHLSGVSVRRLVHANLCASPSLLRSGHWLSRPRPCSILFIHGQLRMPSASIDARWEQWLSSWLQTRKDHTLLRHLRPLRSGSSSVKVEVPAADFTAWLEDRPVTPNEDLLLSSKPAREVTLFSTNDYLGLSRHPDIQAQIARAAQLQGNGPRASALVAGYTHLHRELEMELSRLKDTEDCLLFPTGFAANMGTVASLGSHPNVVIFSDELNHASIIDGARLASRSSGAVQVYRHNDMHHLEELLSCLAPRQRPLVVTDTLFSMDGDFADLRQMAQLKKKYGFMWVVDEAHATLVCGDNGGGACEAEGVGHLVDCHVGTLSKAFGASGGFVACSPSMKQFIMNSGRPYIFSTALPIPVVQAASSALAVSMRESWRRTRVWRLVDRVREGLGVEALSPIIPLVIGAEADAIQASRAVLQEGFHVPAIRPPTVAPGTCRLRLSLSAAHTEEDVDRLVATLKSSSLVGHAGGRQAAEGHRRPRTSKL